MESTFNYFEAAKPIRDAIATVGTAKLAKGETISLGKALASFGRCGYCEPEIYTKAVDITAKSILALA